MRLGFGVLFVIAERPVGRLALKPPMAERVRLAVIIGGADAALRQATSSVGVADTFSSRRRLAVGFTFLRVIVSAE